MTGQDIIIEAERLYDGTGAAPRHDVAVHLRDGRIVALGSPGDGGARPVLRVPVLAPGFVDLQINGAADAQFNDAPDVATLRTMAAGAARGGTSWLLPTFITAPGRAYASALDATRDAIAQEVPGILGLHLEGPFLSPRRPGIHPADAIRRPDAEDLARLCQAPPGAGLITLAPEEVGPEVVSRLAKAGWTVFAGHSEAGFDTLRGAAEAGLSGATHLYNAMSQMTPREPGLVGAALGGLVRHAGIIADGHHVHPANLSLAARTMPDRLCLVTDAMLTLEGTRDSFEIGGKRVFLRAGRLVDDAGTLGGAHLSMIEAVRNMIDLAGLRPEEAIRMATDTPARALGRDDIGRIAPGRRAGLVVLSRDLEVLGTLTDGTPVSGGAFEGLR
ncbi:N-acetylglucosamine-6-phosphate deacetylase [Salipiger mucosus]|nr:N-acetylglucosamine-6-phosphate deacetylase [Salipiger mucosus]